MGESQKPLVVKVINKKIAALVSKSVVVALLLLSLPLLFLCLLWLLLLLRPLPPAINIPLRIAPQE